MSDELKFSAALKELEQIVATIERDEVDVDELADKVDRAAFLVKWCREQIASTELRVKSIIDGLDEDGT